MIGEVFDDEQKGGEERGKRRTNETEERRGERRGVEERERFSDEERRTLQELITNRLFPEKGERLTWQKKIIFQWKKRREEEKKSNFNYRDGKRRMTLQERFCVAVLSFGRLLVWRRSADRFTVSSRSKKSVSGLRLNMMRRSRNSWLFLLFDLGPFKHKEIITSAGRCHSKESGDTCRHAKKKKKSCD